jgi:hypothetical protein
MYKLASVALSAAIGIGSVACSLPAVAEPYVSVGIGLPAVAVVAPYSIAPAYYAPHYRVYGPYWHRDFYRGYDRFHRHWYPRWDHGWDRR